LKYNKYLTHPLDRLFKISSTPRQTPTKRDKISPIINQVTKRMAKMTKSAILDALAGSTELTKKDVGAVLDAMATLAYKEVKKSGEFVVPGIGKLVKIARKARMGRNPATGEQIKIAAKTVVKSRVAKAAKDAVL